MSRVRLKPADQCTGGVLARVEQVLHELRVGVHQSQNDCQATRHVFCTASPQDEGKGPVVVQVGALLVPVPVHVQHGVAPPVPRFQDGCNGVGE